MYRRGEDWAEVVSTRLGRILGIPCATTELARLGESEGSISLDLRPSGWSLAGGGVLIADADEDYAPRTSHDKRKNRIGHTLDNIERVLNGIPGPAGGPFENWSAFDVFAGFLVFDAWIANRDRHEENWAVLQSPDGTTTLAPSFDHGAALGSGLTDGNRESTLSNGIESWCRQGTAHRFQDGDKTSLVSLAHDALARSSDRARDHWLTALESVSADQCHTVLEATPRMSDPARRFALSILITNRGRLCNDQ